MKIIEKEPIHQVMYRFKMVKLLNSRKVYNPEAVKVFEKFTPYKGKRHYYECMKYSIFGNHWKALIKN